MLPNYHYITNSMAAEETWVATFHDLPPGAMRYVEIDGLPIALARVGGQIYAFGDACRHEGGSLACGTLIGDTVTCPWHGWTYSVRTGKAIIPPIGLRVPTYAVRVADDDVFVTIEWPDA